MDERLDSPPGHVSREAISTMGTGKIRRIKQQKSRSQVRNTLRRNIKTTFSTEGLEIDPDKRALIARQFEDNQVAYE